MTPDLFPIPPADAPPDNVAWRALTGRQHALTIGNDLARRLVPGLPPLAALALPSRPDIAALQALAMPGETLYVAGVPDQAWPGFEVRHQSTVQQMVYVGKPLPDFDLVAVQPLQDRHDDAMARLVAAARPGPYGRRARELGDFVGLFINDELVAMAGTRLQAGDWVEISPVCAAPAYEGRGLATVLTRHLVRRLHAQGRRAFVHVDSRQTRAVALYRSIGFATVRRERLLGLRRVADVAAASPAAAVLANPLPA